MGVKLQLRTKLLDHTYKHGTYTYNSTTGIYGPGTRPSGNLSILYIVEAVIDDGSYSLEKRKGTIELYQQGQWWCAVQGTHVSNSAGPYTYAFESSFNETQSSDGTVTVELFRVIQEYGILNKAVRFYDADGKLIDISTYGSAQFGSIHATVRFSTGTDSGDLVLSDTVWVFGNVATPPNLPEWGSDLVAANNIDLGATHTISVYKPKNKYLKVKYSCTGNGTTTNGWVLGDENNYASIDGVNPIYKDMQVNTNWTSSLRLAEHFPTTDRITVTFTIYTYNDDHTLKTIDYANRTYILPSKYIPSCQVFVEDDCKYYEKYGAYIAGKSKYRVNIHGQGIYGSRIDRFHTTANGEIYTTDLFTTNVIANAGDSEVTATVRDSRGRTYTETVSTPVISYSIPNITDINAVRCDRDGTANKDGEYMKVVFSAVTSPLNDLNETYYFIKYKKTSESDDKLTVVTLMDYTYNNTYNVENAIHIFKAEPGVSYNVIVEIQDDFEIRYRSTIGSSGSKILSFLSKGAGLAIGKIAELADHLDIGWTTRFRKPVILDNSQSVCGIANSGDAQIEMLHLDGADTTVLNGSRVNITGPDGVYINGQLVSKTNGSAITPTLWTGERLMDEDETAVLSEQVSAQLHGVVLVWSYYNGSSVEDVDFQTTYIPKDLIAVKHPSPVVLAILLKSSSQGYVGSKRLIIADDRIAGHNINVRGTTESGAGGYTDSANRFALRYVIGV